MTTPKELPFSAAVAALVVGSGLGILVGLYFAFVVGFVLSRIWLWHAVPSGLPVIAWQQFAALTLALGLLRGWKRSAKDERTSREKFVDAGVVLLMPWMSLAIAWVLT